MNNLTESQNKHIINKGYTIIKKINTPLYKTITVVANKDNQNYTIQIIKKKQHCYNTHRINVLLKLNHPNILKYYDITSNDDSIFIIYENEINFSNTLSNVLSQRTIPYDEIEIKKITNQIILALNYLHGNVVNTVHRNLITSSILIDDDYNIKLHDFGLSYNFNENIIKKNKPSKLFISIEAFNHGDMSKKSDIWSLGCIIIVLAGGSLIQRNSFTPTIPDHLSVDCQNFIQKCLIINPNFRSTAKELLNHKFLINQNNNNNNNNNSNSSNVPLLLIKNAISNSDNQNNQNNNIAKDITTSPLSLNSVNRISFGKGFNSILGKDYIPYETEIVLFNEEYNQPLGKEVIPETVKTIVFGNQYNQQFIKGSIPEYCSNLVFGDQFNQEMNDYWNIYNVELLFFGIGFNKLQFKKLPPNLESLVYHGSFEKPLQQRDLPIKLIYLKLVNHNQIINVGCFPRDILFLTLGNNQSLDTIKSFKNLPTSIIDLSFGCTDQVLNQITYDMIPSNISNLLINGNYIDLNQNQNQNNNNLKSIILKSPNNIFSDYHKKLELPEYTEYYSDEEHEDGSIDNQEKGEEKSHNSDDSDDSDNENMFEQDDYEDEDNQDEIKLPKPEQGQELDNQNEKQIQNQPLEDDLIDDLCSQLENVLDFLSKQESTAKNADISYHTRKFLKQLKK